jgi:hypothetical protein
MNKTSNPNLNRALPVLLITLAFSLLTLPLQAANYTWTGATDGYFSTTNNWDSFPYTSLDKLFFPDVSQKNVTNDLGSIGPIFVIQAGGYTFDLTNGSPGMYFTAITNETGPTVFNGNLIISASRFVYNTSGTITFNGSFTNTGSSYSMTFSNSPGATTILNGTNLCNCTFRGPGYTVAGAGSDTFRGNVLIFSAPVGALRAPDANPITFTNQVTWSGDAVMGSPDTGNLIFSGPIVVSENSVRTIIVSNSVTELSGIMSVRTNVTKIKMGPGTLIISGVQTNAGATTNLEGTLLVNGYLPSAVIVASNAVLGGLGGIGTDISILDGGKIQGGDATYSGTLTNGGTLMLGDSANAVTYSSFNIADGGKISCALNNVNGTNYVNILDGSLTVGTNTLITYGGGSIGGSGFAGYQLGTLPSGVTANLLDTGSAVQLAVTVVGPAVNPDPTNIVLSVTGSDLNLSWPADHTGWQLETQTNNLDTGLSGTWYPVAGSTTTNAVSFPINQGLPAVFFRLTYP